MGIFDGILSQIGANIDAGALGERVGLPPEKVEQAIAALGVAHTQPGDTVETAAASSGIAPHLLGQILEQLGGEGALDRFASLLGKGERGNPLFDGLSDLYKG